MMGFMLVYPIILPTWQIFIAWLMKIWLTLNLYGFSPSCTSLFIPIAYGALIGFSLLEDRDDNVLTNIKVTPLSIHQFLSFRLVGVYILCVIATIFVVLFSNGGDVSIEKIIAISLLASLEAPISVLLIKAFEKKKLKALHNEGRGKHSSISHSSLIF